MQTNSTKTQIIQITTCDPSTRTIQGQQKDQTAPISITIKDIPMIFRWPAVGEMWRIQQRSNNWYLQGRIALASDNSFIEDFKTGQALADASALFLNDGSQVITTDNAITLSLSDESHIVTTNNGLGGDLSGNLPDPTVVSIGGAPVANAIHQPGDLIPSAATSRIGALICDGKSYDPTVYPKLYAAIGTTYGGTNSVPLKPDLRGRLPIGAGTGTAVGATYFGLGTQPIGANIPGGEQTHTLTSGESGLPAHSHSINDNGHSHGPGSLNSHLGEMNVSQGTQSTAVVISGQSLGDAYPAVTGGVTAGATTGISINNNTAANASSAHNILPPVSVINWFIVTG